MAPTNERESGRTFRPSDLLAIPIAIPALWHLAELSRIFASRLRYPMDIEWLEGAHLYQAGLLARGVPIYGPPSNAFVPFPYTPGYFALVGLAGRLSGLDWSTGRAVSVAFFALACLALALPAASMATGSQRLVVALLAAAAACASYPAVAGWYDLVRVDSMAAGLLFLGAALASSPAASRPRLIVAGIALALAVLTKQSAIFAAGWILLFTFARDRRSGIAIGAAFAFLGLAVVAPLQAISGGWFLTWTTSNVANQAVDPRLLLSGLRQILAFAPQLALLPLAVLWLWRRDKLTAPVALFSGVVATGFAGLWPYAQPGGSSNNLILAVLPAGAVSLMVALAIAGEAPVAWRNQARWAACALGSLFVALHVYAAGPFLKRDSDHEAARLLNEEVRALEGGVVAPAHPFLALRNGHTTPQPNPVGHHFAERAGVPGINYSGQLDSIEATHARWLLLADMAVDGPIRYALETTRHAYLCDGHARTFVVASATLRSAPYRLITWRAARPGRAPGRRRAAGR